MPCRSAQGGEPTRGLGVGVEGVRVPDMGGEELSMTRRSASGSGASSAGSRPSSIRSTGSAVAELRIAVRSSVGFWCRQLGELAIMGYGASQN